MSKVEVDQVTQQSGTTLTVGGGACKTAVVDATTVTLGRCGGTVSLASGATQSGFGRTGTVDWITTPKVTGDSPVTGVTGKGYFLNTTAGTITINLPAGAAGSIVSVQDYNNNFATANLTIDPNGSEKINGGAAGAPLELITDGQGLTFIYVDSTVGWKTVHSDDYTASGSNFVVATGGTITTVCSDYKVHTFTSPGTFTVTQGGSPSGSNTVSYMVIAGGGGGGTAGGGGGAGGFREGRTPQCASYTASPLNAPAGLPVSTQGYPITVGGGGAAHPGSPSNQPGCKGNDSIFSSITSAGGGAGRGHNAATGPELNGGSGGGGGSDTASPPTITGGTGNTPPVSPPQGNNGGTGSPTNVAGGGGGATGAGSCQTGGAAATTSINATPTARAGGGGGGPNGTASGGGGAGIGGPPCTANPGTVNTGGGGGGGWPGSGTSVGGQGGSGVVIIRYKFQ